MHYKYYIYHSLLANMKYMLTVNGENTVYFQKRSDPLYYFRKYDVMTEKNRIIKKKRKHI